MATPNTLDRSRDDEIMSRRSRGESNRAIARAIGCTDKSIARRLAVLRSNRHDIDGADRPTLGLDDALREAADWLNTAEAQAARLRHRGDDYDCEHDLRLGGEALVDADLTI